MARSVSYLTGADIVVYKSAHHLKAIDDWEMLEMFVEDIIESLKSEFPSLRDCDRWEGNETHIVLENGLCEIAISEYCGLVSISARIKDKEYFGKNIVGIARNWLEKNVSKFEKLGDLTKIGTLSNGEEMFRGNGKLISSKEGVCDWY